MKYSPSTPELNPQQAESIADQVLLNASESLMDADGYDPNKPALLEDDILMLRAEIIQQLQQGINKEQCLKLAIQRLSTLYSRTSSLLQNQTRIAANNTAFPDDHFDDYSLAA